MEQTSALPLQQHQYYADALKLLGRDVRMIDVGCAAPVLAVRQFGQLMTSRGPIWRKCPNDTHKVDALRRADIRLLNANQPDEQALRTAGYRQTMTPASVAELDLTVPPDVRVAQMKPKWRNVWRRTANASFHMQQERFDAYQHDWLLKADLAQQRRKRFRGLPHALLHAYVKNTPQNAQVFVAYTDDQPIAAMLFLLHAPVATYHIGWTSAHGRSVSAHHQMIMHTAETFAKRGYQRLDLGFVDTDNVPGLARFKIGCGAQVRALGGTWIRLPGC